MEPISWAHLTTPPGPFLICLLFLLKKLEEIWKVLNTNLHQVILKLLILIFFCFSSCKHSFCTLSSRSEMYTFSFLITSIIWSFQYFCFFSPAPPKLRRQLPEMNSSTIYLHLPQFISNRCASALVFPSIVKLKNSDNCGIFSLTKNAPCERITEW